MSAHGVLPSGGSLNQPQIMTQTNTATNSLAKMKTIGDLKSSNHNNNQQQPQDIKNVQSMINNLHINTSQRGGTNRFFERKTIACLSQDRTSANNSTRANLSFGSAHHQGASNHHNAGVPGSATQTIVPPTYSSQLAQQFSLSQTRAQSSINTYSGVTNANSGSHQGVHTSSNPHHSMKPPVSAIPPSATLQLSNSNQLNSISTTLPNSSYATIDNKGRRLKKFQQLQDTFYSSQLDPADIPDARDPQTCAEYACDIFEFLLATETENIAMPGYMDRQEDINEKMRAILIDWLVEVHLKFKLVPESLYLTINLIDRFLEKEQVNRQKLQLVGVTAMLIACKYEEIYPPIVKDFVYITDNAYTKEEILEMERRMLQTLDFNIQITSSYRFLERFTKVAKVDALIFNLSRYLLELSLVNYKFLKYSPSNLASSALYLSLKMTKHPNPWSEAMAKHTHYKEQTIR
jgi:G2/mitotic-specific cyclin-B, other